jgi:hypothetical protein
MLSSLRLIHLVIERFYFLGGNRAVIDSGLARFSRKKELDMLLGKADARSYPKAGKRA